MKAILPLIVLAAGATGLYLYEQNQKPADKPPPTPPATPPDAITQYLPKDFQFNAPVELSPAGAAIAKELQFHAAGVGQTMVTPRARALLARENERRRLELARFMAHRRRYGR